MRPVIVQLAWILQICLGITYLVAGLTKMGGNPTMVTLFQAVGAGQWFRYVVGATETSGGVLLFTPRFSGLAAIVLCPMMLGAVAVGFVVPGKSPVPAVACLLGLVVLAWLRRAETARAVRALTRR
jgi:putative oxidoreductase